MSFDYMNEDRTGGGYLKRRTGKTDHIRSEDMEKDGTRKGSRGIGNTVPNGSAKHGRGAYGKGNSTKKKLEEIDSNIRFVNPYNFIPLETKCNREIPKTESGDSYTGYFDCSLQLLTHLFIPNTSSSKRLIKKGEDVEYKGYDFFSYDNWSEAEPYDVKPPAPPSAPVIPGSEIRGAVRSVFEAAFNGCMSTVDAARVISRRSTEIKRAGILEENGDGTWGLKECNKARLLVKQKEKGKPNKKCKGKMAPDAEYKGWKEGQEIWIKVGTANVVYDYIVLDADSVGNASRENELKQKEFNKGYLHKGEDIEPKNYEAVFYDEPDVQNWNVSKEEVELLKHVVSEYQNEKKNKLAKGCGWYKDYEVSKKRILVYFSRTEGGHFHLSPACIGKEVYLKKLESLLEKNGNYLPCKGEELCPACQIFGMMEKAEKSQTNAYGSKVRVTDAKLASTDINSQELFEEPIVLPELGEPRPSAVEFYTYSPYYVPNNQRGEAGKGYWTYDYKYEIKGSKTTSKRLDLNEKQPRIRGRKYYWHHDVKIQDYKKDNGLEMKKMRQRIRPMKPNINPNSKPLFQFRVYFEGLSKKQLNQLKWALDFGDTDCAHKMGRAKPLGFGSVRIIVDQLYLRKIDEKTGRWYITDIGGDGNLSFEKFFNESGFTDDSISMPKALKVMANWKNRPENVTYPKVVFEGDNMPDEENVEASYHWFRNKKGEDVFHPNFKKVLPEAVEDANKKLDSEKTLYELIRK